MLYFKFLQATNKAIYLSIHGMNLTPLRTLNFKKKKIGVIYTQLSTNDGIKNYGKGAELSKFTELKQMIN